MQALRERLAVKPEDLRRRLDPATLPFQTTAEVAPVETTIGQPRAAEAIVFALEVGARGFHLYAAGSPGTGRESTVLAAVRSFAATRPTPPDWVYVHNFAEPDRPRAFPIPAGQGRRLAKAMTSFLEAAQQEIPRAFENEDYARRREQSLAEVSTRRAKLIADLRAFAQEREFALEMTPTGIASIPLQNGQPMPPQGFEQLPPETKAELEQRAKQVQTEVGASMRQMRQIEKEAQERVTALDRGVVLVAAGPLIAELCEEYGDQPDVLAFVEQIETDLPEHLRPQSGKRGKRTARPRPEPIPLDLKVILIGRLRDHQRKLTARFLDVARLAVEASHWAGKAGHEVVLAEGVDAAIAQEEWRRNLVEERTREVIVTGMGLNGAECGLFRPFDRTMRGGW
jgi:hypothetical protein